MVKNVFFDEISQILAFSEKTWFGMHHFVVFCGKKKLMLKKKNIITCLQSLFNVVQAFKFV